jgi:hypothetical protein
MNLIKTPLEKATGALDICDRRLAGFQSDRTAKAAQVEETADFDASFGLREELAVIDRKIAAATAARDHAAGQVERAQREAAEAEDDRRHAAAQKLARAGEKLTLDVVALSEKLADALAALEANRAQVDATNEVRGSRPFVVDGERRIREVPGREVPAVTRRETQWVDDQGNRPTQYVERGGEMIPAFLAGQFKRREVEVVEVSRRFEPSRMPSRLASETRLVDLHGRQLWPIR